MKTKRLLMILLVSALMSSMAFGMVMMLPTAAGTEISNYAIGNYNDANGNAMKEVNSNTVTTVVSQVAGLDMTPTSVNKSMVLNGTVVFPMTITNTGNGPDSYDLSNTILEIPGASFTAKIYYDKNENAAFDEGDVEISKTSEIEMYTSYDFLVVVENIEGYDNATGTIIFNAISDFDEEVESTSELSATINTSVFTYTMTADNQNPQPGEVVSYRLAVNNTGSATANNVRFTTSIATNTTYRSGTLMIGGSSLTDENDEDDDSYISGGKILFSMGDIESEGSASATFQVIVNDNVSVNTVVNNSADLMWDNILDESQTKVEANANAATLTIAQIYIVTLGADGLAVGDPSDYVTYDLTVTNTGNGPDVINLQAKNELITTWKYYLDTNVNAQVDEEDKLLVDSNSDGKIDMGTMAQGASVHIIAKGQIPAGTPDETVSVMILTGTSAGNSSKSDDGQLSITVTAPILRLLKSVAPAGNQPPGTVLTYTVTVMNAGTGEATDLVISDDIPENTTYETGTLKLGGTLKTDKADDDDAMLEDNKTVFKLSTLEAGGTTTVEFKAKIN